MQLTLSQAKAILEEKVQNQNLRRHCYAVGLTLKALYKYYKEKGIDTGNLSEEEWELIGILHDSDWEITTNDHHRHTLQLIEWLKDYNVSEEIINVFRSHNTKITNLRNPETLLEWSLECCDELTGFIVAVALIMPTKKLSDVAPENILKKFKQEAFAKAVDRKQIAQCEEKLGIKLEDFVTLTLNTMRENHELLGL